MYDFYCPCGGQIHFSAVYSTHAVAYRALELLGWEQHKGQWLCPECRAALLDLEQNQTRSL